MCPSMPVILGAILNDWLRRSLTKQHNDTRKNPKKIDTVAEVKHRHGNSVASLERARVNQSIIYIIMRKKAPIYKLSRSKAPKTQKICHYRHARKTSVPFCVVQHGCRLSAHNNFKFPCKSFRSCRIYNSLIIICSYLLSHFLTRLWPLILQHIYSQTSIYAYTHLHLD